MTLRRGIIIRRFAKDASGQADSGLEDGMGKMTLALAALLCLVGVAPAEAAHFPPSAIVKVCRFDSDRDRANCDAFLRGSLERLEARAIPAKVACRSEPFGPSDVSGFLQYASAHMIPDSGEAIALAFNYWASRTDEIPCNTVPGYWTAGHLLGLCLADDSGASPCKFYLSALMGMTQIEEAIANTQYFCPKGSSVRSDDETLDNFRGWIAADPRRAAEPAALGYVRAMMAAYPC
jgi:Rap1a immunity proteins